MGTDLLATQTFLVTAIRRDAATTKDPEMLDASAKFVTGSARLSPAEQVNIYRDQFFTRHENTLREDYPGLQSILGKDATRVFFRKYLAAFPPKTPSLRDLGADLPAYAVSYDGFPADRRALVIEMAAYELDLVEIFDAPNVPPLEATKLATMTEDDWQTARIVIHPYAKRLSLSYPVHRMHVAAKNGEEVTIPSEPSPVHVLLFRQDIETRYEELSVEAFALMEALMEGLPLLPALERVAGALSADRQEQVMANVGTWFRAWTAWGVIVDIVRKN